MQLAPGTLPALLFARWAAQPGVSYEACGHREIRLFQQRRLTYSTQATGLIPPTQLALFQRRYLVLFQRRYLVLFQRC